MEYNRMVELANIVFGQDLLREMILQHAIPYRNKTYNGRTGAGDVVRTLRMVSRSWCHTITKLFQKSKEPLFKIILNANNSVSGTKYVEENGKALEQLVNGVVNVPPDLVPTFAMACMNDFFRRENHESLTKCLQHCGAGLLELRLGVPKNGGSLPPIFQNVSLPQLKRFVIYPDPVRWRMTDNQEIEYESKHNITPLIHVILSGAIALEEFSIYFFRGTPQNFEYLIFPSAITKLRMVCKMENVHLNVLLKNSLPNLTTLELLMPESPFSDGLLFRVLKNYAATLETLCFLGFESTERSWTTTLLRLPVFDKLESLQVASYHCELEPNLSSLERCLPNLYYMVLQKQTADMFRKWTENSKFSTVRFFKLELIKDNVGDVGYVNDDDDVNDNFVRSLDLEMTWRIHRVFPNLQTLCLQVSSDHCGTLQYIFKEMIKLEGLKVTVLHAAANLSTDFWDALFIGTSVDIVADLRTKPDWRLVELGNEDVPSPSIKMLKNLRVLHLENEDSSIGLNGAELPPLISDLVFHFAFLKMSRLNCLSLRNRFCASVEMIETWRSQRKTLDTDLIP